MKRKTPAIILAAVALAAARCNAGLIASDNAGNYSSWGSTAGSATQSPASGSIGISGWTFNNTAGGNGSQNGSFLGTTANNTGISSPNGNVWGLYANSGQTAAAIATFSEGNLLAGQHLTVQMQNQSVGTGGTVGFSLQNGSGQNVLEFYFVGGQNNYTVNVFTGAGSSVQHDTGVAWTQGPLTLDFSQEANGGWSFSINGGNTISSGSTGNSLWSDISDIRFFDYNSGPGNNVYFNNLQIVPEPVNLALGCFGGLFAAVGLVRFLIKRRVRLTLAS